MLFSLIFKTKKLTIYLRMLFSLIFKTKKLTIYLRNKFLIDGC